MEKEGRCDEEIKRRVATGKATMIGLEKIWRDKHMSIEHGNEKKDSGITDFPDSFVWL